MSPYKRYRGRKPGQTRRTICRALCGFGFLLALGAAGNSDMGEPLIRVIPPLLIGLAMFAGGGYFGDLFL